MNKILNLSMFVFALCISPAFAMADSNALSERERIDTTVDTTTTRTSVTSEAGAPSATESGDIGEENVSLSNTGNYPDGEPGSKDENPGIPNPADSETRVDSYPRGDIGAEYPDSGTTTTTTYEETTVNAIVDDVD